MKDALVIGFGNTLRSDDGVGVWIADKIADLEIPGVDVRTCHQLNVDLAADIAEYKKVVCIDASSDGNPVAYRQCKSEAPSLLPNGHNIGPEALARMAYELYGATITFNLFTVRGESFEFGHTLSPSVENSARRAVNAIAAFLRQQSSAISNMPLFSTETV
ncbi:MAG TPA: hydrogenase maturation protease [Bacteroidota bacterium]|nr:hydrogenase maturation protease [Bacteroidota bacterium]